MPYGRSYRRKRRYYKRRQPRYGYFGKFGNDATKAIKMAGKALSLINVENHRYDNTTSIANQTTTATVQTLGAIAQGDNVSNRQGNSIKMTQIDGRIGVYHNGSATKTFTRVIVGVDHQCNGALPAATDVLAIGDVFSLRNMDQAKRYTILVDEVVGTDTSHLLKWIEFHKPLDFHMEFKGTSSAVTDISTNNLFLIAVSDEATNGPQIERMIRLKWIDN